MFTSTKWICLMKNQQTMHVLFSKYAHTCTLLYSMGYLEKSLFPVAYVDDATRISYESI